MLGKFLRVLIWLAVFWITVAVILSPFLPKMLEADAAGQKLAADPTLTIIWNLSSIIFPGLMAATVAGWKEFREQPKRLQYIRMGFMAILALAIAIIGRILFYR